VTIDRESTAARIEEDPATALVLALILILCLSWGVEPDQLLETDDPDDAERWIDEILDGSDPD